MGVYICISFLFVPHYDWGSIQYSDSNNILKVSHVNINMKNYKICFHVTNIHIYIMEKAKAIATQIL